MDEPREFQDWEVLPKSDVGLVSNPDSVESSRNLGDVIESDSEGMIRANYFASDSAMRYSKVVADVEEDGSSDSSGPNWVDPSLGPGHAGKIESFDSSGEEKSDIWMDSSGFAGNSVLGKENDEKNESGFKNSEEKPNFWLDSSGFTVNSVEGEGSSEIRCGEAEEKVGGGSDSGGFLEEEGEGLLNSGEVVVAEGEENGFGSGDLAAVDALGETESSEGESRKMVWWKLPLELLKFCVFKVSPVWSLSIAAAVMGFVILGRRLYKMRRKSYSFPLKVSVEDKKVSQFMIRAAKLNEAFSVVRRIPVVRSTLPAGGLAPWPVMGLN